MSSSDFAPVLSSSPPPFEDGPSFDDSMGNDDDDDDFGDFSSAPGPLQSNGFADFTSLQKDSESVINDKMKSSVETIDINSKQSNSDEISHLNDISTSEFHNNDFGNFASFDQCDVTDNLETNVNSHDISTFSDTRDSINKNVNKNNIDDVDSINQKGRSNIPDNSYDRKGDDTANNKEMQCNKVDTEQASEEKDFGNFDSFNKEKVLQKNNSLCQPSELSEDEIKNKVNETYREGIVSDDCQQDVKSDINGEENLQSAIQGSTIDSVSENIRSNDTKTVEVDNNEKDWFDDISSDNEDDQSKNGTAVAYAESQNTDKESVSDTMENVTRVSEQEHTGKVSDISLEQCSSSRQREDSFSAFQESEDSISTKDQNISAIDNSSHKTNYISDKGMDIAPGHINNTINTSSCEKVSSIGDSVDRINNDNEQCYTDFEDQGDVVVSENKEGVEVDNKSETSQIDIIENVEENERVYQVGEIVQEESSINCDDSNASDEFDICSTNSNEKVDIFPSNSNIVNDDDFEDFVATSNTESNYFPSNIETSGDDWAAFQEPSNEAAAASNSWATFQSFTNKDTNQDIDSFKEIDEVNVDVEDITLSNKSDVNGSQNNATEGFDNFVRSKSENDDDEDWTFGQGNLETDDFGTFSEPDDDEEFTGFQAPKQENDDEFDDFGKFDCQNRGIIMDSSSQTKHSTKFHLSNNNQEAAQSKVAQLINSCFNKEDMYEPELMAKLLLGADAVAENNGKNDISIFTLLCDMENTVAIKYQWNDSQNKKHLLNALHVDTRNMLVGHKKPSVPIFAAGLGMLEPTKGPLEIKQKLEPKLIDTNKTEPPQQDNVPPVEFDWSSSGLTNPLDSNQTETVLDLDFFSSSVSSGSRPATSKPSELESEFLSSTEVPKPAPVKTLQSLESLLSKFTPTTTMSKSSKEESQLSEEASKVVSRFPNLAFMKAKVLMFPLKNDTDMN